MMCPVAHEEVENKVHQTAGATPLYQRCKWLTYEPDAVMQCGIWKELHSFLWHRSPLFQVF